VTHAESEIVRLAGFDDFVAARDELALVVEEIVIGIFQLGVALIILKRSVDGR